MESIAIRFIVFACIFGAALLGIFLRAVLPKQHLTDDSKDAVKMGIGVISTMAALVLGLLVASAKNFYDAQSSELTQLSANVILLDRILAHYGPETKDARDFLRGAVARTLNLIWHQDLQHHSQMEPTAAGGEILYDKIQALSPKNDAQHALQNQASSMALELGKLRWLMFEQGKHMADYLKELEQRAEQRVQAGIEKAMPSIIEVLAKEIAESGDDVSFRYSRERIFRVTFSVTGLIPLLFLPRVKDSFSWKPDAVISSFAKDEAKETSGGGVMIATENGPCPPVKGEPAIVVSAPVLGSIVYPETLFELKFAT